MEAHGFTEPRFESLRDCLTEVIRGQAGAGAAFAAWFDGRRVADLWGGSADAAVERPWRADAIVMPYSVSKPFAAVCVLHLAGQGRLDLDAPVQRYWPEFRAPATVRQILAHQAGVVALDQPAPVETFYDWDGMCRLLAAQEPEWEPGTAHGECAQFYGHLTGEIARRVDGRRPGQYLQEEICGPKELDFFFGLNEAQQDRAVRLAGLDDAFRAGQLEGKPPLFGRAIMNPPGALDPAVVSSGPWRAAEIPALNGHGTARAVADFYHALAAGRILPAGLLAEAITVHASGPDRVFGEDAAWGLGFGLDGSDYGMGGIGGSYGGTNQAAGYSIAYLTGCVGTFDPLGTLENEFRRCLGLPPLEF